MEEKKTKEEFTVIAKNISKTFIITEDYQNTIKQRLFTIFNRPVSKTV
jgi:hypothetical protein